MKRRRLRKVVPDAELFRRRAAGEPLRDLASDYGVSHTTLSRFFERPDAAKQLRQAVEQHRAAQRILEARRLADRRFEREVRQTAKEQAAAERTQATKSRAASAALVKPTSGRLRTPIPYESWLDERDAQVDFTRADLHSQADLTAAYIVGTGGGLQAVIDATFGTRDNVLRLIDPEILARAIDNDAVENARSI